MILAICKVTSNQLFSVVFESGHVKRDSRTIPAKSEKLKNLHSNYSWSCHFTVNAFDWFIIFFSHLKHGRKIIHLTLKSEVIFTLTCQLIMFDLTLVSGSDIEIFLSPNYSKFAVECDWNSKCSHKVQNLGCFLKKRWVFSKKCEFSQNR